MNTPIWNKGIRVLEPVACMMPVIETSPVKGALRENEKIPLD